MVLLYNLPFFLLVGWFFYRLAAKFNKDKWRYAFQGILILFLSTFLIGYLFDTFILEINPAENSQYLWILWFALTLSVCAIYYRYLKKEWSKTAKESEE